MSVWLLKAVEHPLGTHAGCSRDGWNEAVPTPELATV